ncbi:MBL fold metallo-hydrolase [Pendulispora brunnea]|uniref:MBL fold metallo-hydrolase n=1 Tax=Pendulispora brunnea TaxID=2905690 RepID=A0ABZ2KHJ4_9BACT
MGSRFRVIAASAMFAVSTMVAGVGSSGCGASEAAHSRPASSQLGVFTSDAAGFETHSFWYDTGREVVVFDAQFTEALARKVIAEIHAATASPIRYVVVTHPNPDKFNGASAFRAEGARIVASKATAAAIPDVHAYKKHYFVEVAKMFTAETYPAQATIDETFEGDFSLPLTGEGRVELHELKHAGVSSTQTVAYVPGIGALVVGDLVHVGAHAWLEGGIVHGAPQPRVDDWKLALDELLAYPGATVYGGRGASAKVEDAVAAQKRYLDGMHRLVADYVKSLGPRKSELLGDGGAPHYQALTQKAEKAFPELSLSYLIAYGVYGLAGQIASGS